MLIDGFERLHEINDINLVPYTGNFEINFIFRNPFDYILNYYNSTKVVYFIKVDNIYKNIKHLFSDITWYFNQIQNLDQSRNKFTITYLHNKDKKFNVVDSKYLLDYINKPPEFYYQEFCQQNNIKPDYPINANTLSSDFVKYMKDKHNLLI